MRAEKIETVIVGGGQAGLATSYHLARRGREHLVLERADAPGSVWRDDRWDSFTLVTPNWTFRVPGAEYSGDEPGGFMPRDEVVSRFRRYVADNRLPVRFGTTVTSVERADGGGYRVRTDAGTIEARDVVVATGLFQKPKVAPFADDLPKRIVQTASGAYRSPDGLPDGAVLVVGSAQSGAQIAEELYTSGRTVYLAVGRAGRFPRRYRGRDIVEWLDAIGWFDATVDTLPSPRAKFTPNPQVSGKGGGRSLNLHRFARDGVVLLGHLRGADGETLALAPDLHDSLTRTDRSEADVTAVIDRYIRNHGIDAPAETLPLLRDGYDAPERTELDLAAAGITSIVWAMGYSFDFRMVRLPVLDADGYPVVERGVTAYDGLYFVGLPWLHTRKSGLLLGVGEDAEFIARHIEARSKCVPASTR